MKTIEKPDILFVMAYYLRLLGTRPELWLDSELVYKQLAPAVLLSYLSQAGESVRLDVYILARFSKSSSFRPLKRGT